MERLATRDEVVGVFRHDPNFVYLGVPPALSVGNALSSQLYLQNFTSKGCSSNIERTTDGKIASFTR